MAAFQTMSARTFYEGLLSIIIGCRLNKIKVIFTNGYVEVNKEGTIKMLNYLRKNNND